MKTTFDALMAAYAECETETKKISEKVKAATDAKDFKEVIRLMNIQREILQKYSSIETELAVKNDSENYQALSKALSSLK